MDGKTIVSVPCLVYWSGNLLLAASILCVLKKNRDMEVSRVHIPVTLSLLQERSVEPHSLL
uniref:Uncharacterized protein n=1 Tax=Picea sitchensis TaxID=3332 RepID=A0A6B9XTK3_PICSI|nr:hypothetical protein Q903MT_gene5427 [Picea sitchensis]